MSIGKICNREVHLAQADEPIQEAANRMLQRGVGCLVVIDDEKVPIGLLTDRDLAVRAVAYGRDAATTPVRDLMTAQPRFVSVGLLRALPASDQAGSACRKSTNSIGFSP